MTGPLTGPLADLPARRGDRPRATLSNPHTQLDQQPDDDGPRRLLEERLAQLPGVVWRPSMISVPGARALTLPTGAAQGPAEAFMVGAEFAHLHPAPDHSLHLVLPPDVASRVIEAGWAEQHPVARRGLISAGAVMVYAPRDAEEAELVFQIVGASFEYARSGPA
ncbi:MAG TPA: luciferase family protein [Nocardioides sp.]|uniref:luciferase domain-containing protein n=1 Tax=Nocardioides sp. TaxID=35761 RepID=UPI002ED9BEA8